MRFVASTNLIIANSINFNQIFNMDNVEENQIELKKVLGNVEDETLLNIKENYEIWDIINSFNTYVCGDLAFYATIIGRDNTSHCSCPYCDLPRSEW